MSGRALTGACSEVTVVGLAFPARARQTVLVNHKTALPLARKQSFCKIQCSRGQGIPVLLVKTDSAPELKGLSVSCYPPASPLPGTC